MSQIEASIYCHTCRTAPTFIFEEELEVRQGGPVAVPPHRGCSGREGALQWQQPLDEGCQLMEEEFPDVISTGDTSLTPQRY